MKCCKTTSDGTTCGRESIGDINGKHYCHIHDPIRLAHILELEQENLNDFDCMTKGMKQIIEATENIMDAMTRMDMNTTGLAVINEICRKYLTDGSATMTARQDQLQAYLDDRRA